MGRKTVQKLFLIFIINFWLARLPVLYIESMFENHKHFKVERVWKGHHFCRLPFSNHHKNNFTSQAIWYMYPTPIPPLFVSFCFWRTPPPTKIPGSLTDMYIELWNISWIQHVFALVPMQMLYISVYSSMNRIKLKSYSINLNVE